MKEKSSSISRYIIVLTQRISINSISCFADHLVAGIIGAAPAVNNDHPLFSSKIPGITLTGRFVLILPRVQKDFFAQAAGNVSYQGGKANHVPATQFIRKLTCQVNYT